MGLLSRNTLATVLDRAGLATAILSLRRASSSAWITVLTYHRVARPEDAGLLDEGVIDVTPEQLDRQLAVLKRWFVPIGVEELRAHACGRGALPHNPVLVTFDDGYRDNHDVALPILLRHGVRASFFVATYYAARRRLYWWDRVSLLVKRSRGDRLRLTYPEPYELPLDGLRARRAAIARIQRLIKDRERLDLERLFEDLERASEVVLGSDEESRLVEKTVMTWEDVARLRSAGMDVQSHTHTHRVLQTLDDAALASELRVSRAALEDVLCEPVRSVSYPVGKPLGDERRIRRAVRDAGYDLGFSNGTGVNRADRFDPLDACRVALDISVGEPLFRATLAFPWLAS